MPAEQRDKHWNLGGAHRDVRHAKSEIFIFIFFKASRKERDTNWEFFILKFLFHTFSCFSFITVDVEHRELVCVLMGGMQGASVTIFSISVLVAPL